MAQILISEISFSSLQLEVPLLGASSDKLIDESPSDNTLMSKEPIVSEDLDELPASLEGG